jgi:hypothetical protein
MIDDQHPRAINRRAWGPVSPRENDGGNDRHRVQIAAVEKLHLAVDGQTLCGLVTVDELDVYPDEAALHAWNDGPLEQCAECQAALLAPIRPSAQLISVQKTSEPDTASTPSGPSSPGRSRGREPDGTRQTQHR